MFIQVITAVETLAKEIRLCPGNDIQSVTVGIRKLSELLESHSGSFRTVPAAVHDQTLQSKRQRHGIKAPVNTICPDYIIVQIRCYSAFLIKGHKIGHTVAVIQLSVTGHIKDHIRAVARHKINHHAASDLAGRIKIRLITGPAELGIPVYIGNYPYKVIVVRPVKIPYRIEDRIGIIPVRRDYRFARIGISI